MDGDIMHIILVLIGVQYEIQNMKISQTEIITGVQMMSAQWIISI
jgi:hypothetical protein